MCVQTHTYISFLVHTSYESRLLGSAKLSNTTQPCCVRFSRELARLQQLLKLSR